MTAYLRKPHKVPEQVRKEIEIIIGDVFDAEKVAEALEGKDVVISCLGTGANLCTVKINKLLVSALTTDMSGRVLPGDSRAHCLGLL